MNGAQKFHIQLTDLNLSAYGSLNLEMFANSSPGLSQNQHHSLGLGCQSSILLLNCLSFNRYKDPSESLFINLKYKNSVSILVTQPTNFPWFVIKFPRLNCVFSGLILNKDILVFSNILSIFRHYYTYLILLNACTISFSANTLRNSTYLSLSIIICFVVQ